MKDYLKLIPEIFKHPKEILQGWINDYNFENLPEEEVKEILKRRSICEECPFNSINAKTSQEYLDVFQENYSSTRDDLHCSACLCPITKLTACLDCECGLSKNIKTKNLKLKWNKKQ